MSTILTQATTLLDDTLTYIRSGVSNEATLTALRDRYKAISTEWVDMGLLERPLNAAEALLPAGALLALQNYIDVNGKKDEASEAQDSTNRTVSQAFYTKRNIEEGATD